MDIAALASATGKPVILIGTLTKLTAQAVLEFLRTCPADVLFSDAEIDADLLRARLRAAIPQSVSAHLLRLLRLQIDLLPDDLLLGSLRLFGTLPLPSSAHEFSLRLGIVDRTAERRMKRAGFRSTARLLMSVRLALAWDMLRQSRSLSIEDMAARSGYATVRRLRQHARGLLGLSPHVLIHTAPSMDLLTRLALGAVESLPRE